MTERGSAVDNRGRRNVYLAAAITLIAMSFLFYPSDEGMHWLMWRDAPLVAVLLVCAAAVLGVLWWRTPRI